MDGFVSLKWIISICFISTDRIVRTADRIPSTDEVDENISFMQVVDFEEHLASTLTQVISNRGTFCLLYVSLRIRIRVLRITENSNKNQIKSQEYHISLNLHK